MGTEIVGRCPPHVQRIKQELCVSEVKKTYTTRGDSYSIPEDDEYIPPFSVFSGVAPVCGRCALATPNYVTAIFLEKPVQRRRGRIFVISTGSVGEVMCVVTYEGPRTTR
jgi:hypothetical protein